MPSRQRPKLVTLISLGVLILATIQLARFALGLALPSLPLTVPPVYIPLTGLAWGLGAAVLAFALFFGRPWAPGAARWGVLAYAIWFWADRLLLVSSDYGRMSRPASLGLTVFFLLALWWTLRRPSVRNYFREMDG